MRSHEVDYKIFGDDLQFVEIELDPGESVIAEAGTMMYLEEDITFETKMGDGSDPGPLCPITAGRRVRLMAEPTRFFWCAHTRPTRQRRRFGWSTEPAGSRRVATTRVRRVQPVRDGTDTSERPCLRTHRSTS